MKQFSCILSLVFILGCGQQRSTSDSRTVNGSKQQNEDLDSVGAQSKSLDSNSATQFVPTMQHELSRQRNVVYAPTFLFAWEELRKQIGNPIEVGSSADLLLVNQSSSFRDALSKNEYALKVSIVGEKIDIVASFKKNLPFEDDMDTVGKGFTFQNKQVKAFGMPFYRGKIDRQLRILYYENDERFILKITPKDGNNEIVLAKGFNSENTFEKIMRDVNDHIKTGHKQAEAEWNEGEKQTHFNYSLSDGDVILIAVMKFDYFEEYTKMIGQSIVSGSREFYIETATQKNAFTLDEKGAKVESGAEIVMIASAEPSGMETRKRKKLLLNKEFLLVLRKQGAKYPYFMAAVNNTDFMLKR